MLCPNWFNEPPLSNIPQAAVGSYIGGFNTQAATILHEMTHVYSSSINGIYLLPALVPLFVYC
jgi:hypothetical protein